jgi:hypothetical protein
MLYRLKLKSAQASTAFAWLMIEIGEARTGGRVGRLGEWLENRTERLARRVGLDLNDLYAPAYERGHWRKL